MHLHSPVRMKYFHDLEIGELCQVQFGTGPGLSFPIAKDGTRRLIAILQLGDQVRPMVHEVRNLRTPCLSYGQEWVLSPDIPTNAVPVYGHSETPGSIHFNPDGAVMYLAPFSREAVSEGYPLGLPAFGYGQISHDSIVALRWKLWISEQERTRVGATPLLEFSHQ
ncbi:hypothetical protein [Rhizobium bangladeshense]|uniref:hypothetical protein n=1 Tax=Rhizobium bangladeshense TaxID=1138189 RepID=UPI001C82DA26|nr:hypothetical protein [Rhizobium bangladeshense]MBX4894920.1 hypothetical protein [Rhizobium bangladeshense]